VLVPELGGRAAGLGVGASRVAGRAWFVAGQGRRRRRVGDDGGVDALRHLGGVRGRHHLHVLLVLLLLPLLVEDLVVHPLLCGRGPVVGVGRAGRPQRHAAARRLGSGAAGATSSRSVFEAFFCV